jgi:hypothetical protein
MEPEKSRELKAVLEALEEPPPMTLDEALASADPVSEIARRIGRRGAQEMTDPEKVFWSVAFFAGAVMNGGLEEALDGDGAPLVGLVAEFARRYGSQELRDLMQDVSAAAGQMDPDCLDALTERFFEHEDDFTEALVALASKNRDAFDLAMPRAGKGG